MRSAFPSVIDMVLRRGAEPGLAYRFLETGEVTGPRTEWSNAEVLRRASAIAAMLQDAGAAGERVLLLYPPDIEFIAGFLGSMLAGAVAVPTYPPDPSRLDRTLPRLRAIARDCEARFVLTSTPVLTMARAILPQVPELSRLRWIASDRPPDGAEAAWKRPEVTGETLAFLQYTSGSTGSPKGVMVSHGNILHNEALIAHGFGHDAGSSGVGWLPMFHDMGLLGLVLQPLYVGFPVTLMSPLAFLARPLRWLEAISQLRATSSGGPNFAYELCLRKIGDRDRERLDLRSWRVAFNGAEPISADTLDRFADAFASCGFRRQAFYPCYGLAESTLIVTGGESSSAPIGAAFDARELASHRAVAVAPERPSNVPASRLISSGRALLEQTVMIVDPETCIACAPDQIGEIWVAGPSVARGYWNLPDDSTHTFAAFTAGTRKGPFLRTGDLGFLHDGELFVTGRCKDLIIIRGRNLYPQDIEYTVERAHAWLRTGGCACFSVERDGEERLAVVAEVEVRGRGGDAGELDLDEVVAAIRGAVAEAHEIAPHAIVLIRPRSLPKTSSGKVQRRSCREDYLRGLLSALTSVIDPGRGDDDGRTRAEIAPYSQDEADALRAQGRLGELRERIEHALRACVAGVLDLEPARVERMVLIPRYGLDSLRAIELVNQIRDHFRLEVSVHTVFESSIADLAAWIDQASLERDRDQIPAIARAPGGAPYPLSLAQERLWHLERGKPGAGLYNITFSVRIHGPLDVALLNRGVCEIVRRHDVLRAHYQEIDGRTYQGIAEVVTIELPVIDLQALSPETCDAELHRIEDEIARPPFDLLRAPMVRGAVIRTGAAEHVLAMSLHHSIADGRSVVVLLRELSALYEAFSRGAPSPLAPLALQYRDYAAWQRAWLTDQVLAPHIQYWRAHLHDAPPPLQIPTDWTRGAGPPRRGERHGTRIPLELTAALKQLGQREGATLFMTSFATYALLLHRLTGQSDIVVGVPLSNRPRPELDPLIGQFLNNFVLRVRASSETTFDALLRQVRRVTLDAYEHRHLPFDVLLQVLQPFRGDQPLYRLFFNMIDIPPGKLALSGLSIDRISSPDAAAKRDVTFYLIDTSEGLALEMVYDIAILTKSRIEHMLRQFCGLLTQIVERPNARLADYAL